MARVHPRQRVVQAGKRMLQRHAGRLAVLSFIVGVAWFILLPTMARRPYISENALMPGNAVPRFGTQAAKHAVSFAADASAASSPVLWFIEAARAAGLRIVPANLTVAEFAQPPLALAVPTATLLAERGSGQECVTLAWDTCDAVQARGYTTGLITALMRVLAASAWRAPDIVFLPVPCVAGMDASVIADAWVRHYHSVNPFAGHMLAALHISVPDHANWDAIDVSCIGAASRLPNLDLRNAVLEISRRLRISVAQAPAPPLPQQLRSLLSASSLFSLPDIVALESLLAFMRTHAAGVPSGIEGVFPRFHVDSMHITGRQSSGRTPPLWRRLDVMGRVVESTVRSLSNLLEHMHQSFFLYLLAEHATYIPIGDYLPPMMAIGAGPFLLGLSTYLFTPMPGYQAAGAAVASYLVYGVVALAATYAAAVSAVFSADAVAAVVLAAITLPYIALPWMVSHSPSASCVIDGRIASPAASLGSLVQMLTSGCICCLVLLTPSLAAAAALPLVPAALATATHFATPRPGLLLLQHLLALVTSPHALLLCLAAGDVLAVPIVLRQGMLAWLRWAALPMPLMLTAYLPLHASMLHSLVLRRHERHAGVSKTKQD